MNNIDKIGVSHETIAALATPPGNGGIGIIRISGKKSKEIANKIFKPSKKNGGIKNRYLSYGRIMDNDKIIDEVLVSFMQGPHSFTGEDVIEINGHGGRIAMDNILSLVISNGARIAQPGEFTRRAFLNGRIDLSQAEAIMDIINASSDSSFNIAVDQLNGSLSDYIKNVRDKFIDILVNITVNIDYPDEDIEEVVYSKLLEDLQNILVDVNKLYNTYERSKIVREGYNIALVGRPNVGKSALMNSLVGEDRAIVTDIAGTTRDLIEVNLQIDGNKVTLVDTAGIREASDYIEKIGIEKSKEAFNKSELVLVLLDGSMELTAEDIHILENCKNKDTIIVITKDDLNSKLDEKQIYDVLVNYDIDIVRVSSKELLGIDKLKDIISNKIKNTNIVEKSLTNLYINERHKESLSAAISSMKDAITLIENSEPLEIVEIDINHAYESILEIIGENASIDIIDKVFERFCLGK